MESYVNVRGKTTPWWKRQRYVGLQCVSEKNAPTLKQYSLARNYKDRF